MANCKVVYGISNVCGDLLQASGVDKDFYVGYISDLSARFSLTQTAAIGQITFIPYNGLIKFEGQKYSHKASYDLTKGAGGGIAYTHKFTAKMMNLNTVDDVELQRLTQAQDMFIISPDNNENIFIYAPSRGFQAEPGQIRTTGENAGEDVLSAVSFTSAEKVLPLRFTLGGTYLADITYLNSLIR